MSLDCIFTDDDGLCCELEALTGNDFCELHAEPKEHELGGEARRARRVLFASTKPRVLDQQALLPFEHRGGGLLVAETQKPFQPRGLLLWDVGLLNVEAAIVGAQHQLMVAFGRVPARWWTTQQSFDAVVRALADGKEAASWGSWDVVHPGCLVRLQFDGPADGVRAVMWGLSS